MKVVIYNKNLNPDFWDSSNLLKPEIRKALLEIASTFIKDVNLKTNIKDVLFLGSSANYNWSPTSDIDLHILIDLKTLPMDSELAKDYIKVLARKWNADHSISIRGHNVEVYIQDVTETNRATGVYSLTTNNWIKKAEPQNISLDKNLIQQKYTSWVKRITDSIKQNDLNKLKSVLEGLVKMREAGLSRSGEFSTENIVFKILRQRNFIGKLKDKIQQVTDKNLSMKEIQSDGSITDAFDPTSFGPNVNRALGDVDQDFYKNHNNLMKNL